MFENFRKIFQDPLQKHAEKKIEEMYINGVFSREKWTAFYAEYTTMSKDLQHRCLHEFAKKHPEDFFQNIGIFRDIPGDIQEIMYRDRARYFPKRPLEDVARNIIESLSDITSEGLRDFICTYIDPYNMLFYREKLHLSEDEAMLVIKKRGNLAGAIAYLAKGWKISSRYHQEIVVAACKKELYQDIFLAARNLENINIPYVFERVFAARRIDILAVCIRRIPSFWIEQLSLEQLRALAASDPLAIFSVFPIVGKRIGMNSIMREMYRKYPRALPDEFFFLLASMRDLPREVFFDIVKEDWGNIPLHRLFAERASFRDFVFDGRLFCALFRKIHPELLIKHLPDFFRDDNDGMTKALLSSVGMLSFTLARVAEMGYVAYEDIFASALQHHWETVLVEGIKDFPKSMHLDIAKKVLASQNTTAISAILLRLSDFFGLEKDKALGKDLLSFALAKVELNLGDIHNLYRVYGKDLGPVVAFSATTLGDMVTKQGYLLLEDLFHGKASSSAMVRMGVTHTGHQALQEVKKTLLTFSSEIMSPAFSGEILKTSELHRSYFQKFVHYSNENPYYYRAHLRSLTNIEIFLKHSRNIQRENMLLDHEGKTVQIQMVDGNLQKVASPTPDAIGAFHKNIQAIKRALERSDAGGVTSHYFTKTLEDLRESSKYFFEQKISQTPHEKTREEIVKKQQELSRFVIGQSANLGYFFKLLLEKKEHAELLREYLLLGVLDRFPKSKERLRDILACDDVTFSEIKEMFEILYGLAYEMTWKGFFPNTADRKVFEGIFKTHVLERDVIRCQNFESTKKISLHFFQTRGILLDFTGDISGTCMKDSSGLAENFPNLSAVIFVQDRGTRNERLVGSCLLLEAEDCKGNPILIIRALNPAENLINDLALQDFFDVFVGYAREIAKKSGRTLAIAISENIQFTTNRMALHLFIRNMRKSLVKISIPDSEYAYLTVNGRAILDSVYAL